MISRMYQRHTISVVTRFGNIANEKFLVKISSNSTRNILSQNCYRSLSSKIPSNTTTASPSTPVTAKQSYHASSSNDQSFLRNGGGTENFYADEDILGLEISNAQDDHLLFQQSKVRISTLQAAENVDEFYAASETTDDFAAYEKKEKTQWTPQMTKIVATIGPTSEQFPELQKIVKGGMRIMRLNFSHATVDEVELRVKNIRACKGRHTSSEAQHILDRFSKGSNNLRAVLLDTRGPEIRTGKLRNDTSGKEIIQLEKDQVITLHTNEKWREAGSTNTDLFIDYPKLDTALAPGKRVLLDDGAVILVVKSVNKEQKSIECIIQNSGELRSRAGVNLPGVETDLPPITEKDKADIKYGLTKDIDYIAASFVQNAAGVREIKRYVNHVMINDLKMDPSAPPPLIISKIETMSALRNFHEILMESDGIMVARGDLGVEIPIQQVTNAQKEMVAACNAFGKPVIVATQMLESMAKNPRPTRAEVADVTNAVYDGADCVMLSGESAKGRYPIETVKMMNEIILTAERFGASFPELAGGGVSRNNYLKEKYNLSREVLAGEIHWARKVPNRTSLDSVAKAAVMAAEERKVRAIIVLTVFGYMPRLISTYRPHMPIVAFCPSEKIGRQLMIHRGVHPVLGLTGISPNKMAAQALKDSKDLGFIHAGDEVVIVNLEPTEGVGLFASMKVCVVPSDDVVKKEKVKTGEQIDPGCI